MEARLTLYLATTATHRCLVEADTANLAREYAEDALRLLSPRRMVSDIVVTVEEVTLPHILPN